jgi:hypothetical protein
VAQAGRVAGVAAGRRRGFALAGHEALLAGVAGRSALRDRVDETPGDITADAEEHEAASQQERERHVDHLDRVASAAAAEVEEHRG